MTIDATVFGHDLADLNDGFLALVLTGSDAGLPGVVAARLCLLDQSSRERLTSVSFALFGFGFEDEAGWAGLLSPGVRDLEPGHTACEPIVERFTLLALTTLRSFIRMAPYSVSAWAGLPRETRTRLATMGIAGLGLVAPLASTRLRGRLADREAFWLRLIDAAEKNDARQLALLAALGRQWTIRRSLGLSVPPQPVRGFRR